MKKLNILVVPITVLILNWFFYTLNDSFKVNKTPVINNDLEEYVIGVVGCEMPALYNEEALKAQSIISRTYALYVGDYKNDTGQCYLTNEELINKWGKDYDLYYNKIKDIVYDTSSLVIKRDNKLLKTYYFSTSNGYTLDSLSVFNDDTTVSVESLFDKESKNYYKETIIYKDDLINIFGNFNNIIIKERDNTHHVNIVCIDNNCISGIEFRKKLNLRSTDFDIKVNNNEYTFITYGYGHGVGLSQSGANYLANNGYSYIDILNYYYKDIEISNY